MKKLARLMGVAAVIAVLAAPGASATTLVVDGDGKGIMGDCNDPDPAYSTIQAAVDAATEGDMIFVCNGTYDEQVEIATPDLTLAGESIPDTVIEPILVTGNTTSLFSGNLIAAIVLVDGVPGVTVTNLTVDGSGGVSSCGPAYIGIFYRAASGTISDTDVVDVRGCKNGGGILVQSGLDSNANASVTITGNMVSDYGKNGITANEAGTAVVVTGNTVTGRGLLFSGDAAQNGIQIGFGARGLVSNNEVSGNDYEPTTWVACGLLFFEGGGGLGRTKTNDLHDNEKDICTAGAGAPDFDS